MPNISVQATFERVSGLPEDRIVNNWHFSVTGTLEPGEADAIRDLLDSFYFGLNAGGSTVGSFLAGSLTGLTYKMYNLADLKPRPVTERPSLDFVRPAQTGIYVPHEVAVCLSYYADRNLPRQRGRIYIGPLGNSAIAGAVAGDNDSRQASALRPSFATAGARLIAESQSGFRPWVVYSPTDLAGRQVTDGWIDDAFDTQRRRGRKPAVRELFT